MARAEPGGYEARLIADVAPRIDYPPTPDLRARTLAAVAAGGAPSPSAVALRRRVAFAALALVLAAVGLTLALPTSRHAVGEFFGLVPGERIERLTPTPMPTTQPPAAAAPAITPSIPTQPPISIPPWEYARPITLADAPAVLGFDPALPAGQGTPDGVYLAEWGNQALLILEYPDFDLWQTRGGGFVGKGLPESAQVETPNVNGTPAYWLVSGPYDARFYDAQGHEVKSARRTISSHVLIWRGVESYYRIETELPLDAALAIARTLP